MIALVVPAQTIARVQAGGPTFWSPDRPQPDLDRLQQLSDLHDRGVLTDDEYVELKARILGTGAAHPHG